MGVFTSKRKVLEVGERAICLVGQGNANCKKYPFTLVLGGERAPGIVLPLEFSVQLLHLCCGQEGWRRRAGWWWGPGCPRTLSRDDGLCVLGGPLTLQQHFSLSYTDELHVVFPLTPQGTTSCFSTSGSSRRDCLGFLKAAQSLLFLADQALAPDLTFTTKPHLRSHFPFPGF